MPFAPVVADPLGLIKFTASPDPWQPALPRLSTLHPGEAGSIECMPGEAAATRQSPRSGTMAERVFFPATANPSCRLFALKSSVPVGRRPSRAGEVYLISERPPGVPANALASRLWPAGQTGDRPCRRAVTVDPVQKMDPGPLLTVQSSRRPFSHCQDANPIAALPGRATCSRKEASTVWHIVPLARDGPAMDAGSRAPRGGRERPELQV